MQLMVVILDSLFGLIEGIIFLDCILSWIPSMENKLIMYVHSLADPFCSPFRKIQQKFIPEFPLDFSPIIAIFIIEMLKNLIVSILQ